MQPNPKPQSSKSRTDIVTGQAAMLNCLLATPEKSPSACEKLVAQLADAAARVIHRTLPSPSQRHVAPSHPQPLGDQFQEPLSNSPRPCIVHRFTLPSPSTTRLTCNDATGSHIPCNAAGKRSQFLFHHTNKPLTPLSARNCTCRCCLSEG